MGFASIIHKLDISSLNKSKQKHRNSISLRLTGFKTKRKSVFPVLEVDGPE